MDKINDLLFESIWAVGDVLVMKRAAVKLDLERWSKDYWIDEWGEDECGESVFSFSSFSSCLRRESVLNFFPFFLRHVEVIDSQTREVFKVTVENFFEKVSFRRVSLSPFSRRSPCSHQIFRFAFGLHSSETIPIGNISLSSRSV